MGSQKHDRIYHSASGANKKFGVLKSSFLPIGIKVHVKIVEGAENQTVKFWKVGTARVVGLV